MGVDVLIIGPATRDVNTDYDGRVERSVGGAIWFGAAAAACAGARVGAALMVGASDTDIAEAFPGLGFCLTGCAEHAAHRAADLR